MSETFNKGSHANIELIRGDPKKAIRQLSWPMMISMFLIVVYNLADSIWVSGLGADALAALGFVTPLFMIIVGLGNGIGAGANSLIARAIGGENKHLANNTALHSIIITIIIGILAPVILLPILPTLIEIMGGASTMQYALDYGYIVFGGMFVFIFSSLGSAILRSEGDVKRATIAMAITAILNIILDPIFIYTLGMGMAGAALATILSALIACIVMAYWIFVKKDTYMDVKLSEYKASRKVTFEILKVAIPSTAEQLIISILAMAVNAMLVMVASTDAVASYTAGMRVVQMAMIPLMGLGTALLTVAGAAYGARSYEKFNTSFSYTVKLGFLISIVLAVIVFIFSPQLALVFSYSEATSYLTSEIANVLRILCGFLLFMAFGMCGSCLFQGVGRGTSSLIITLLRSLICEVILAYLFGIVLGYGEMGIYCGVVLGSFIGSMFGYFWARSFVRRTKKIFK